MSLKSLKRRLSKLEGKRRKSVNLTKTGLERMTKAEIERLLSEPQKLTDKELELLTGGADMGSMTDEELNAIIEAANAVKSQGGKI